MDKEILLILQFIVTLLLCIERIFKRCKKSSCCNHFIDLEMQDDTNKSQKSMNI